MTDEASMNPDDPSSAQDAYRELALSAQKAEQLQNQITDLMTELNILREAAKVRDGQDELVSQLRTANENLVRATFGAQSLQAEAESANRAKEEFLSMLAHELRNPLAPIMMAGELIGKILQAHPHLPKLQAIISRQTSHLSHLVDDLLDASRISSGKFTLSTSPLLLTDVIQSAVETSRPMIDKHTQHLTIDFPAEPIVVEGDAVRLGQVFSNLLTNASKFTPESGHIRVFASVHARLVTVSILDDGVGIAPDIQPFIFDLFTQGPRALDRSDGGLGIGLALVRTIVEMHGGAVIVKSAGTDSGSEFIVQLPVSVEQMPSDTNVVGRTAPTRQSRILIIEDNADASYTLQKFLTLEGHTVMSAPDGLAGVTMARENSYDVIICDLGLPGIDGYEVVAQLRASLKGPMPCFIAVTGYNQIEHRIRANASGFDHYLVKPVTVNILLNLIAQCTRT